MIQFPVSPPRGPAENLIWRGGGTLAEGIPDVFDLILACLFMAIMCLCYLIHRGNQAANEEQTRFHATMLGISEDFVSLQYHINQVERRNGKAKSEREDKSASPSRGGVSGQVGTFPDSIRGG